MGCGSTNVTSQYDNSNTNYNVSNNQYPNQNLNNLIQYNGFNRQNNGQYTNNMNYNQQQNINFSQNFVGNYSMPEAKYEAIIGNSLYNKNSQMFNASVLNNVQVIIINIILDSRIIFFCSLVSSL